MSAPALHIAATLPTAHRTSCARNDPTPGPCDCGAKPVPLVRADIAEEMLAVLQLVQRCLGGSDEPKLLPRTTRAVDAVITKATGATA